MKIRAKIKSEFKSKTPVKVPSKSIISLLNSLYVTRKFSQVRIGKMLGVQGNTVRRWLDRCDIPVRNRYESVSLSLSKSESKSFSGNSVEKAYLIGIRCGDLSAQKHGRKIRIAITTTHSAMLTLFNSLFEKYAKIGSYPKYDKTRKRYLTCVYCDLDGSFDFLIGKADRIPKWILNNAAYFYSFLAGYFDAEGCISIDRYRNVQFIIKSCDKGILCDLRNGLDKMGFDLHLYLVKKADGISYNKDYWYLGTGNRSQITSLLGMIKPRHAEKLVKARLLNRKFSVTEVEKVRRRIKDDIIETMKEAEVRYSESHKTVNILI